MTKIVCSTTHLYHYVFNEESDTLASMLEIGMRPLSHFPESERWKKIQEHIPGMFKNLYENFVQSVIQKPYSNSGIFVTPIDFYRLPGTYLHDKTRIAIPVASLDPGWSAIMYVLDDERHSLALNQETFQSAAEIWHEDMVREWFGKDKSKVFFYVPQVVTYQPDGIPITEDFIETPSH